MRDSHRMKEKFDLSLDNRQIVSLLIAGLVVLGAVFVLGVVVGKKLATNQQTAAAPDLLTALDKQAAVMDEVHKDSPLTFQDELTKKSPEPVREVTPPPQKKAEVVVAPPLPEKKPEEKVAEEEPSKLAESPVKDEETTARTHDGGLKEAFANAQKKTATPPAEAVPNGKFT